MKAERRAMKAKRQAIEAQIFALRNAMNSQESARCSPRKTKYMDNIEDAQGPSSSDRQQSPTSSDNQSPTSMDSQEDIEVIDCT